MGKKFLEMQKDRDLRVQEAARDTYEQYFADMLSIALNDPNVMGRDTFGHKRIKKLLMAVAKLQIEFIPALNPNMNESDYKRERMDRILSGIFPEGEFVPFDQRYDYVNALVPLGEEKK